MASCFSRIVPFVSQVWSLDELWVCWVAMERVNSLLISENTVKLDTFLFVAKLNILVVWLCISVPNFHHFSFGLRNYVYLPTESIY
jgi:hypothetical protein